MEQQEEDFHQQLSSSGYLSPVSGPPPNNEDNVNCAFGRFPVAGLINLNEENHIFIDQRDDDSFSDAPRPCSGQINHYETIPTKKTHLYNEKTSNGFKDRHHFKFIIPLSLICNLCLLIGLICLFFFGIEKEINPPDDRITQTDLDEDVMQSSMCFKCELLPQEAMSSNDVYTTRVKSRDHAILCCFSGVTYIQILIKIMNIRRKNDELKYTQIEKMASGIKSSAPAAVIAAHVYFGDPHINGRRNDHSETMSINTAKYSTFINTVYGFRTHQNRYLEIMKNGLYCIYLFTNIRMSGNDSTSDLRNEKNKNIDIYIKKKAAIKSHVDEIIASTSIVRTPDVVGKSSHQNGSLLTFAELESGDMIFSTVSDKSVIYDFTECNYMGILRIS